VVIGIQDLEEFSSECVETLPSEFALSSSPLSSFSIYIIDYINYKLNWEFLKQ
jgi:hypothetical protein